MQRPWAEAKGTLPKVPMPWHPQVLVIAVRAEWWEDWESGTYPIHSGMSRVFYLPQHRTLSTRHPLALRRMRLTGRWVSADERRYWKSWAPHPGFEPPPSVQQAGILTTRPLSCLKWYIEEGLKCCWLLPIVKKTLSGQYLIFESSTYPPNHVKLSRARQVSGKRINDELSLCRSWCKTLLGTV